MKLTPSTKELALMNRERMKKLNEVFDYSRVDAPLVYPSDFQTYKPGDVQFCKDEYGPMSALKKHLRKALKRRMHIKGLGEINLQVVDGMLNFESTMPVKMQKRWQRNLMIKKGGMSSSVGRYDDNGEISDKLAQGMVQDLKIKYNQMRVKEQREVKATNKSLFKKLATKVQLICNE